MTTVTKRVRRIFTFSQEQYRQAATINRPDLIFLNFCNYLQTREELDMLMKQMATAWGEPTHFGLGPSVNEVVENPQLVRAWLDGCAFARKKASIA